MPSCLVCFCFFTSNVEKLSYCFPGEKLLPRKLQHADMRTKLAGASLQWQTKQNSVVTMESTLMYLFVSKKNSKFQKLSSVAAFVPLNSNCAWIRPQNCNRVMNFSIKPFFLSWQWIRNHVCFMRHSFWTQRTCTFVLFGTHLIQILSQRECTGTYQPMLFQTLPRYDWFTFIHHPLFALGDGKSFLFSLYLSAVFSFSYERSAHQ